MRINLFRSALLTHFFDFPPRMQSKAVRNSQQNVAIHMKRVFIECRIKLYAVIYDFIGHMTGSRGEGEA